MIRKICGTELEAILNKTVQFMTKVWVEGRDARVERGRNSLVQIKGGEQD
jgi:hypothetical protein